MTHTKRILEQLRAAEADDELDDELRESIADRRRELEEEIGEVNP
jgi:trimethylamine:corrinoid methyltransferase-like protein